jgi:hypothetical protein
MAVPAPAAASAEVTTMQLREHGAAANVFSDPNFLWGDPGAPRGNYYEFTIMSGIGEVSSSDNPNVITDWAYIGYAAYTVDRRGNWEDVGGWGGYAPDGAAGLTMARNASSATLRTTIPVGYCAEYAPEDQGGECIDEVSVGTVALDLTWTPTSKLMSGETQESWGDPGSWRYVFRLTGHYRDASVSGTITMPDGSVLDVVSSEWGTLYIKSIGSLDVYVTRGGAG